MASGVPRPAEELFQRALDLPPDLRRAFVREADVDGAVRDEVLELLTHYEDAGETFLQPHLPLHRGTPLDQSAPSTIGIYPVLDELGRGGMGIVYRAVDPRLEREVAIKVLPGDVAGDPSWRERFRREARILASLNHPNIATVYSLEEADGATFLTMELVRGTLLSSLVAAATPPLGRALTLAQQITAALEAAHRSYVAHRDLKPLNVMVTPEGHVKVLDFGLARSLQRRPAIEIQGSAAGTPGYMSPELLRGDRSDHRADVFAFGCVLFEILTGTRAFPGADAGEIMRRTLEGDVDLVRLGPDVPADLRRLVITCLASDPDERLASITVARRTIEELIAHRARPARPSAAASPPSTPTNLPTSLTSFVGRQEVLGEVVDLLRSQRILTLVGPGGSGKSRLAIEAGRHALESFGDGVHFVELAPLSRADGVVGHVAATLGVREAPGTTLADAISADLAGKRALVILDNCEHVLDGVVPLVARLMAASPELVVLTTSLVPLEAPGEVLYRVPSMRVPEASITDVASLQQHGAVRLFVDRAAAAQSGFTLTEANAPAVVSICRRLDGVPLAIELAAARVRVLPPHEIDRRLDDRFRLLMSGARTGPERHRTLRALMDWSYEQLGHGERRLLERLSVFAGGFGLEAAEAVGTGPGVEAWEVLDLLSRLVDRSLVMMEPDEGPDARVRYRMLETVRAYAGEHLDEPEEPRRHHRDHHVALMATAEELLMSPERRVALHRIDHDVENVRLAIEHDLGLDPFPTETLDAVCTFLRFAELGGRWGEGAALGLRVATLPSVTARQDVPRGRLETRLGSLLLARADYDAALERFAVAREVFDAIGDRRGVAGVTNNSGLIAKERGQYDLARASFEEALAINRELGNREWETTNLNNLALVLMELGDDTGAERCLLQALGLARELDLTFLEAGYLNNLGIVVGERGDAAGADWYHREALASARHHGDVRDESIALTNLGAAALELGEHDRARQVLREGLEVKHRLDDRVGMIYILETMVPLLHHAGRPADATRVMAAAQAMRDHHHVPAPPSTSIPRQRELAHLTETLGPTAFRGCWDEGSRLSMEQAIALAFRDDEPPATPSPPPG